MDTANFSEERYQEIATEMRNILLQVGWGKGKNKREMEESIKNDIPIIPMAGSLGENILKKSDKMPWWNGVDVNITTKPGEKAHVNCLLDCLNNLVNIPPRKVDTPMRAPVSQVLKIKGVGDVITSRIEQGEMKPGDEVVFLPTHTTSNPCTGKVFSVEMHHKSQERAGPGDNVGVNMKGLDKANMPSNGDIMIKKGDTTLKQCAKFTAQVQVLDHPGEIKPGYTPVGYIRTSHCALRLEKINKKMGKKTGGQWVEDPPHLEQNEAAEVVFVPQKPFVVESFENCEGLARLAVLEGGTVCMIGKVTNVEFAEAVVAKKK